MKSSIRTFATASSAATLIVVLGLVSFASAAVGGPTVILSSTSATSTNSASIPITATFSAPVSGVGLSDITTTNGAASNLAGSGAVYTFDIAPTAAGTSTVMIPADMASSTDASSTGNQASNTLAFLSTITPPATTTPVISDIAISDLTTTGATITWTTDTNSTSQVFYGTSASYGSMSALNTTPTMSHSVTITGLSEATLYHFEVASGNVSGTATSTDIVFDTDSTASTTPLAITGIDTTQGNATADGTFADGWQWVIHFVIPSVENVFSMKFADFFSSTSSSTIPAANNIRIFSAQSSNASSSDSAILESGNGFSSDLMLTGDTSSTTAGRQIDLTVQVAVPTGTPTGTYSTTFGAMSTTT